MLNLSNAENLYTNILIEWKAEIIDIGYLKEQDMMQYDIKLIYKYIHNVLTKCGIDNQCSEFFHD